MEFLKVGVLIPSVFILAAGGGKAGKSELEKSCLCTVSIVVVGCGNAGTLNLVSNVVDGDGNAGTLNLGSVSIR